MSWLHSSTQERISCSKLTSPAACKAEGSLHSKSWRCFSRHASPHQTFVACSTCNGSILCEMQTMITASQKTQSPLSVGTVEPTSVGSNSASISSRNGLSLYREMIGSIRWPIFKLVCRSFARSSTKEAATQWASRQLVVWDSSEDASQAEVPTFLTASASTWFCSSSALFFASAHHMFDVSCRVSSLARSTAFCNASCSPSRLARRRRPSSLSQLG
mmetsp:Transcript_43505/g.114793  ORF Transcript_43505/g.114793 Transcript_43505/m.114793 type:complete len:217 (-) Transcript_43505:310-960(-)